MPTSSRALTNERTISRPSPDRSLVYRFTTEMSLGSDRERQSGIKANDACLNVVERLGIVVQDSLFGLVADSLLSPKLGDAVNLR
jgi:hypothetical protein